VIGDILLYTGAIIIFLWGVAHIVPTKSIVSGFGSCFIGVLVLLVTSLAGSQSQAAYIVYLACAVMLLIMAILTVMTGARTSILPYKICPVVKTAVAILFFLGSVL